MPPLEYHSVTYSVNVTIQRAIKTTVYSSDYITSAKWRHLASFTVNYDDTPFCLFDVENVLVSSHMDWKSLYSHRPKHVIIFAPEGMQSIVMSMSVCLSVHSHISKTTWPNFAKFLYLKRDCWNDKVCGCALRDQVSDVFTDGGRYGGGHAPRSRHDGCFSINATDQSLLSAIALLYVCWSVSLSTRISQFQVPTKFCWAIKT